MRFAFAFLLSAGFAALAVLVATGTLNGIDQWSVDHLMPGGRFRNEEGGALAALVPFYRAHWDNAWLAAANIVTLPAAFVVSLALTAWRSRALAVLLVAGTAVEELCKEVLERPALYHGTFHIGAFDSSFPSGHTLRTAILAAAFAGPWTAAWAVVSIVLLQLAGWHTPSDIAGGLLLAGLALLGARSTAGALRARRLPRRRA